MNVFLLVSLCSLSFGLTSAIDTNRVCKEVACSSWSYKHATCRIDNAPGDIITMALARRESRAACVYRQSFGFFPTGRLVWVKDGCRARFQVCFTLRSGACGYGCGKNAECVAGKCMCRKGYIGNPNRACEASCTCTVSGDPHFRTFDKQMIHFQGICKYTLVKVTDVNDLCQFNVEVKNERRGRNTRVSFARLVDVKIYGFEVRLHVNKVVYINGIRNYLPVSLESGNLHIYNAGKYVRLTTKCGLTVAWDGRSQVYVQIPRSFGPKVTGLCGDCNGIRDDYRTREGEDVSTMPNRYQLIGQSYQVKDDSDKPSESCKTEEIEQNSCPEDMKTKVDENRYCGYLNPKLGHVSPFRVCLAYYPVVAQEMYESCRYDVCSFYTDETRIKEVVCNILEGLATECESRGIDSAWRKPEFCSVTCSSNMVYSYSVSGCPATCLDQDPDSSACHVPPTEGCQCKEGFVLSGDTCVHKSQCGCSSSLGYLPLNKKITSADCRFISACVLVDGKPFLQQTSNPLKCHDHATCGLLNGMPHCLCNGGYFGDGVNDCEPLCNGKKCAVYAACVLGRCVCDSGYHGNGYSKCEVLGVCGGKTCCANTVCINYNCICKNGYTGDGYKLCSRKFSPPFNKI
ncbi:Zonadhesin [Mizuhopecten yessoensis]|uniref:Zonadhesin n=1 Tax=Mizuhopecten yessoensis TaxID=6573 RepID=A0A210R1D5_MIZYE|nr:Zonadhesin [Mizuhopecten yessoensis]